jgi:hypothetical protein
MVIESDRLAREYESIKIDDGVAIQRDILMDRSGDYLYAMTDKKVGVIYLYAMTDKKVLVFYLPY